MTDMERKIFCAALSRYGAQAQLTERQQRQLNRLLNSIDELDSLI